MIEKKQAGRKSKRPDNKTLEMLYSGMTAREIAEQYGVALSTVARWVAVAREEQRQAERKQA